MAKVYVSSVVNAPAGRVWAIVRDFNGLPGWVPFLSESRMEMNAPPDRIGAVRILLAKDGGRLRERLLSLSDYDLSMSYAILESPLGVENYIASLRLIPVTDGDRTFVEWSAEFDCAPAREAEITGRISRDVFQPAFRSLQTRLGG